MLFYAMSFRPGSRPGKHLPHDLTPGLPTLLIDRSGVGAKAIRLFTRCGYMPMLENAPAAKITPAWRVDLSTSTSPRLSSLVDPGLHLS
jgi:hypothetical protein